VTGVLDRSLFGDLEPISLPELVDTVDLQTRRDRKYLVSPAMLPELFVGDATARVLTIDGERSFEYESVYFDSPAWTSYLSAARRRPRRFKVRTRSYVGSELCVLEVKTRDARQRTVKHRCSYHFGDRYELHPTGRDFVAGVVPSNIVEALEPVLITTYVRSTLVLRDELARVTIDSGVTWTSMERRHSRLPGWALLETKTSGAPCAVDRALWRRGRRPTTISKFGTGLAALHAELPANKWHRVLRQHIETDAVAPALSR
jgi:hypothetical protein